jgi:NitT/TauT family transport system permease protein
MPRKYLISFIGGLVALFIMAWLIVTFVQNPEIQNLPLYTFSTVTRIIITLIISVVWGVSFGILAATNKWASLILTPFIDLLQSIPILGYFPMVIGFLFVLGGLGIELAVIVLLFTSMAWAIFFGVIGAIRGIPTNVAESGRSFGLTGWRYIRHVVLPAITPAVISGANLAWCDGWFFMIAAEYIQYKGDVVPPPSGGLGYLLARAAYFYGDMSVAIILLIYITFIVVYFNTLTWHKLMERANTGTFKPIFKMDLSGVGKLGVARATSWLHFGRLHWPKSFSIAAQRLRKYSHIEKIVAAILALSAVIFVLYAGGQFPTFAIISAGFSSQPAEELVRLPLYIALTMGRLTIAYGISLAVAIGMGVLAAEHKRFATVFYPLFDIGQGVPILALFPVIFLGLKDFLGTQEIALELTCIIMLVLDMIWYMFLNIVSAVKNIPTEMREVGQLFGFKGLKRITHLVIPSILPSIVTGSILSWGTGWNTIIFAEYLPSSPPTIPKPVSVQGLGSLLDKAGYEFGNTVFLIFILGVIAAIVLSMEGLVWRRLLRKFEKYHVEV